HEGTPNGYIEIGLYKKRSTHWRDISRAFWRFNINDLEGVVHDATFRINNGQASISNEHVDFKANLDWIEDFFSVPTGQSEDASAVFNTRKIQTINNEFFTTSTLGYTSLPSGGLVQDISDQLRQAVLDDRAYFALRSSMIDIPVIAYSTSYNLKLRQIPNKSARITYNINTPPILTTNTLEEIVSKTTNLNWSSSDNDSDSLTYDVYYSVNQGEKQNILVTDIAEKNYSWNTESLSTGEYYVDIVAKDGFEETLSSTNVIKVDNNPPAVEITSNYGPNAVKDDQDFFWTAEDKDGDEVKIELTYSGVEEGFILHNYVNTGYYKLDTSNFRDGEYDLTLKATSGYFNANDTKKIVID
ncbi:MAG: hypothetical protein GOV15_00180, partial [Candidatus Diapherotrites archaeon]|nr:hypothetical protein [Candidatus Diapherotrites archaeon]